LTIALNPDESGRSNALANPCPFFLWTECRGIPVELQQIRHPRRVFTASGPRVADAYGKWGKGVHSAGLNPGDCFAFEVAKEHRCPLLFGVEPTRFDFADFRLA
jgi:hypothetical protein